MLKQLFLLAGFITLVSCNSEKWTPLDDIDIEGISASGITLDGNTFWLSHTDGNKIVQINQSGKILSTIEGLDRPMHLSYVESELLVPEYMSDTIRRVKDGNITGFLEIPDVPDAPAAVDSEGDKIAVADFYNDRVIYSKGGEDMTFGKKGKGDGEFHYPTDVQFENEKIYVADAYNHRVQVFDEDGKFLNSFGKTESMNASTGIFVNDEVVVVTDFENDRLLTYDLEGTLLDIIDEGLHRPTDAIITDGRLYVLNFKGQFISVYE